MIAFLALSLLPLFGSNTLGFLRSQEIVQGLVERYLVGVAGLQAVHIQDRLEQRRLYLEAIASGNRFLQAALEAPSVEARAMQSAATPEAVAEYLNRKLAESDRFESLTLYTTTGVRYAWAGLAETSFEDFGAVVFGLSLSTPTEDNPSVLRFATVVQGEDGVVVGTLVATVSLNRGGEFLGVPEHVAGAIESFILDDQGRPVFVSHPHGHLSSTRRFDSPLASGPPGRSATYLDREGVAVIGVSSELPDFGWRFITEVPVEDALAELRGLRMLSWILGGAFFALVVGAAWLLASGIVAPVRRLVDAVRRLGGGDLDARVPPGGGDEIGELGEAFNVMAAELAANQERIESLHRAEIERAEQLATVGEVASGVAHEIKNPVVGISNGLDLVLRHVGDSEELRPITDEMKRQLHRIEQAVRDLLAYARPPEPSFEMVDIDEVVSRALTLVEPGAQKAGVTLDIRMSGASPLVRADRELLVQAVVNLTMNAIQFSQPGSTVVVETMDRGKEVEVTVTDFGRGIEPEVLGSLFKPFFTTRHAGTGLGLSITRGIAERHGGRIDVESTPGEGSRFAIVLPTVLDDEASS